MVKNAVSETVWRISAANEYLCGSLWRQLLVGQYSAVWVMPSSFVQ